MPEDEKKALLIDNDTRSRNIMAKLIGDRFPFKIEQAETSKVNLMFVKNANPDVIFVDVSMPALDGLPLFELIRGDVDLKDTPVIVTSAHADRQTLGKLVQLGITNLVLKPYDLRNTVKTIRDNLAQIAGVAVEDLAPRSAFANKEKKSDDGPHAKFLNLIKNEIKDEAYEACWRAFRALAGDETQMVKLKGAPPNPKNVFYKEIFVEEEHKLPVAVGLFASENGVRRIVSKMQGGLMVKLDEQAIESFGELGAEAVKVFVEKLEEKGVKLERQKIAVDRDVDPASDKSTRFRMTFTSESKEIFAFFVMVKTPD
jgi:CheY-like chemotaxis protein